MGCSALSYVICPIRFPGCHAAAKHVAEGLSVFFKFCNREALSKAEIMIELTGTELFADASQAELGCSVHIRGLKDVEYTPRATSSSSVSVCLYAIVSLLHGSPTLHETLAMCKRTADGIVTICSRSTELCKTSVFHVSSAELALYLATRASTWHVRALDYRIETLLRSKVIGIIGDGPASCILAPGLPPHPKPPSRKQRDQSASEKDHEKLMAALQLVSHGHAAQKRRRITGKTTAAAAPRSTSPRSARAACDSEDGSGTDRSASATEGTSQGEDADAQTQNDDDDDDAQDADETETALDKARRCHGLAVAVDMVAREVEPEAAADDVPSQTSRGMIDTMVQKSGGWMHLSEEVAEPLGRVQGWKANIAFKCLMHAQCTIVKSRAFFPKEASDDPTLPPISAGKVMRHWLAAGFGILRADRANQEHKDLFLSSLSAVSGADVGQRF